MLEMKMIKERTMNVQIKADFFFYFFVDGFVREKKTGSLHML
jgi:hypothetical protein